MSKEVKYSIRRFLISSSLGNCLEFFDFTLYAFCAPLVAQLYFPTSDPQTSILLVWGIFAISFAVRPIGAVFFGYIGDFYGRKIALVSSTVLMSISTTLCGLIPTYSHWGIWAPITLITLRMLQGFSVSAEYNGGSIYIIENVAKNRGLLCSITSFSCGLGILLASLTIFFLTFGYSIDKLPQWRWRLPFIVGGLVIGIVTYSLRRNMHSKRLVPNERVNPVISLLEREKFLFLEGLLISSYNGVAAYVIYTYVASYMQTHLSIPFSSALKFSTFGTCLSIFSALIFGYVSDIIGRKVTMFSAALAMTILAIPMFTLIHIGETWSILLGFGCLSICNGAFGGPMNAAIVELFARHNRYTGSSLSYNLGVAFAGGSAPLIISYFLNITNNHYVIPIYLMIFAFLAMLGLREKRGDNFKT